VAQLRSTGDRGRPPRRARRRGPAQDLRPLHRRAGRRRQPAHHRRPWQHRARVRPPAVKKTTAASRHPEMPVLANLTRKPEASPWS
jgi:hypothetical protein